MIRLSIRQFRLQAYIAFGALVVFAVIVSLTGKHLMHIYDSTVLHCGAVGDCGSAHAESRGYLPGPSGVARCDRARGACGGRDLLGCASRRTRVGKRHVPTGLDPGGEPATVAHGEDGDHGSRMCRRCGRRQRSGHLVVHADRQGQHDPVRRVRLARRCSARLRGIRFRTRCHARTRQFARRYRRWRRRSQGSSLSGCR